MFTLQFIKECFRYSKEDGRLYWLNRPVQHFSDERSRKSWNSKYAGREAGTLSHGYRMINLNGSFSRAHRIIYFIEHGVFPKNIDHINGNKLDNRIVNLRPATRSQNMMNRPKQKNNLSGMKGVSLRRGLWRARITVQRKEHFLGWFKTKEEAFEAYQKAAGEYHGEFANTMNSW